MDKITSSLNNSITYINNHEHVSMGIAFALIIFAAYIAPQLPNKVIGLFDNPLIKLLIFLIVAYSAKKNPTVGIIMAVCLLVVLHTANQRKIEKMIGDAVIDAKKEHMAPQFIDTIQNLDMQNIQNMQNMPNSTFMKSVQMTPQSVKDIQSESKHMPGQQCDQKMKYRNEFYPQYVDLEPNAYTARTNTMATKGYDETCISNDSYPESSVMSDSYPESNVPGDLNAYNSVCGYASV